MIEAMARFTLLLVCLAISLPGAPQGDLPLSSILNFEAQQAPGRPAGWSGNGGAAFADSEIVHGGKWSARIENKTADGFSTITKTVPIDFAGKQIQLRGFMRAEGEVNFGGLWLRQDGPSGALGFQSMEQQRLKPSTEWAEYTLTFELHSDSRQLVFGALVIGIGKAWADDMQLLVDGKPVWEAPKMERPKTILDLDHEFDTGSKVSFQSLSGVQTANLVKLGKVWGFLKYHHPTVTAGKRHWDFDFFRVLPSVLAAEDEATATAALAKWIAALGEVAPCEACLGLNPHLDLHLRPELWWVDQTGLPALREIHFNRTPAKQFYVSLNPNVGNPKFDNEPAYPAVRFPDPGFQLLGLFRIWNIIEYWFPYRDVIGESWDGVLREFIPRIALAKDADSYALEMMALIARVHDTHANLWSSLRLRPPVGNCQLPLHVRFVENRAVVWGFAAVSTGLKIGDVITELDGKPVDDLVAGWKPYYAASNEPTILRDIARQMTRGECGATAVRVDRGGERIDLTPFRMSPAGLPQGNTHDQPGDTFRMLPENVAYLKLSSVKMAEAASYIERAAGSRGLIIDIRNYPSEFMVFALGQLLVDKPTEFARFTKGDLGNPGAFHFGQPVTLTPATPHYTGKIVILVDEVSQSSAEYTTMAFRAAPNAQVLGSTTAGADGNVSPIPLPGGLQSMISGIGVFYPDKKPTQRIGIVPDVEVKPTIAGIRAGRDELLEEAVRRIVTTSGGTPAKP